jgi:hypothetical protein
VVALDVSASSVSSLNEVEVASYSLKMAHKKNVEQLKFRSFTSHSIGITLKQRF